MPGFSDSAVLILLALLLFGPKKLPQLARQLGKLMSEFRRASNEFRTQMEEELRISEQADRQKQIAAIEAAAPPSPAIDTGSTPEPAPATEYSSPYMVDSALDPEESPAAVHEVAPVAIATSGDLSILPPSTGLPIPNTPTPHAVNTESPAHEAELETETLHG